MKSIGKILGALMHSGLAYAAFSSEEIAPATDKEQVIAAVERRIEAGDDNGTVQLELARSIYELRRGWRYRPVAAVSPMNQF